jgi:DNA-binding NtrC family response regulator
LRGEKRVAQILIVDDDPQLRNSFEKLLAIEGHTVRTANSGEKGVELARELAPDLVIQDVRLPGINGLEAFKRMREFEPKLPVIIMTAYSTTETAIEATKLGAFDYVLKPFDIPDILNLIEKALEAGRFMRAKVGLDESGPGQADQGPPVREMLIGRSPVMQELYKAIGRVAPTDATALVLGESGTGKELVARALYQHSARSGAPFLVINCVAIPETLLESELFGYEKGAFTGAHNRRVGKIEQANRGSIFLDEIGDMPLSIQAKLLRLLQERQIERLGGRGAIPVDVRIIAATNRDLEAAVASGAFREDLYYRLNVVTLRVPPLRERAEDIPLLAEYFLDRFSREARSANPGLTEASKAMLRAHLWPGNVRELANVMQKAFIFNRGRPLEPEDIGQAMGHGESGAKAAEAALGAADEADIAIRRWVRAALMSGQSGDLFETLVNHFGALLLAEALALTENNRSRAAKLLGVSRPTLLARIEKYGLKIETSVTR